MKIFCTSSQDTYITNKIVSDNRMENSNVGKASTLDLFKIYNETTYRSSGSQDEISRILIKFDYSRIKKKVLKELDVSDPSFSAKIKLFDITAGNVTPSNFTVIAAPLSQSFIEGHGKDLAAFSDIAASNFITASFISNTPKVWFASGANKIGDSGANNIDYFDRLVLSSRLGKMMTTGVQYFETGKEDLSIDVTKVVSASLTDQMKNHGFRISFSGSDESGNKTRFVKRFASRHVSNPHLRPRLEISFDDSTVDNHENFIFDYSGSIRLENNINGSLTNFVSGAASSQVQGASCMKLKLKAGMFSKIIDVSQPKEGSGTSLEKTFQSGIYTASFAVSSFDKSSYSRKKGEITLEEKINKTGELRFDAFWQSNDGNIAFHTGSLTVKKAKGASGKSESKIDVTSVNMSSKYRKNDLTCIRLFVVDNSVDYFEANKEMVNLKSLMPDKLFYRAVDANTGREVFDFGEHDNSTKASVDKNGPFFNFDLSILPVGRSYYFEYLVVNGKEKFIVEDRKKRFTVI